MTGQTNYCDPHAAELLARAAHAARPPSDTGATGWHTHSGRAAYRDNQCARHDDGVNPARPVIVVDPTEARETIARALMRPRSGVRRPHTQSDALILADAVLAALAGQEGGQP